MALSIITQQRQLAAARDAAALFAKAFNHNASVRLWSGEVLPLGAEVNSPYTLTIQGPGVIGTLLRSPKPETLLRLYASAAISFAGGDLLEIAEAMRSSASSRKGFKSISKLRLLKAALPFLFARIESAPLTQAYDSDAVGRSEARRSNTDYIRFHYDVSNDFYQLFLDKELQYSCGYFTDWENSLEQAQVDKLEMICRKLRLKPGDRLLDIGCGWGGLICYAAAHYGVSAHGVTLSQNQYDFAAEKIKRLGLADRVAVELRDYRDLTGTYDKIASIGMFEHIGLNNFPGYFAKISALLADRGLLLNHGIASRAKRSKRKMKRIRPERRLLLKYIFPGSELAPLGFTANALENAGFEIHDVENWREHYAQTCRHWSKRLSANSASAAELVGPERCRLWLAYLTGVALGFAGGSMRIYQILASKRAGKGPSGLPPTRADLYKPSATTNKP